MNDTLKKKIAIKSRDKYFKFFNSTIDAEFTINKSLNINKKYYWKINKSQEQNLYMKNIIVVTGGAGFIGSNLIKYLLKKTIFKIISVDNYSTGSKKNHINHKNVRYIKDENINISKILKKYTKKIKVIFHFGEFSRIYQSFLRTKECLNNNINNSFEVINFANENKIQII